MKSTFHTGWIVSMSFLAAFLWIGCSSDEGPADGGAPDTTPPAVVSAVALDGTHVLVTYNENLLRPSAERRDNYSINSITAAENSFPISAPAEETKDAERAPALPVEIAAAVLRTDGKSVMLTTGTSMSVNVYDLLVNRVSDVNGNKMSEVSTTQFTGLDTPDVTAPYVALRNPGSGATGVGTSEPVAITFSEPMLEVTVIKAFSWMSSKDTVITSMQKPSETEYVFAPLTPLDRGTKYTVRLAQDALDLAGNSLVNTSWTFTTRNTADTTPPTLVSTVPADGAVDVSTGTVLTLSFSERIDPLSLKQVLITPTPNGGTEEWSSDGRTVSFTPDDPLLEDTQYFLLFPQGSIWDISGNRSTETVTVRFTTGSSFVTGRIDGTLTGDIFSAAASDPTGAIVIATTTELFSEEDLDILGIASAGENDAYSVLHVPDGTYYPFAILDSNNDGIIDPQIGDAFGAYGLDIRGNVFTQTSVTVAAGGTVADVNFVLYDPEAICGTVLYYGEIPWQIRASSRYFVGVFDADGFDPNNPGNPAAWTEDGPLAWDPYYSITAFDNDLKPGTYYVGAYIDVNSNGLFDPSTDPSGFHSNMQSGIPYPITVENGGDALNVDIYLEMPSGNAMTLPSGPWPRLAPANKNRVSLERLSEKLEQALKSSAAK